MSRERSTLKIVAGLISGVFLSLFWSGMSTSDPRTILLPMAGSVILVASLMYSFRRSSTAVVINPVEQLIFKERSSGALEKLPDGLEEYTEIELVTRATGGGASPFEDGNTDYRKQLVLSGDGRPVVLMTFDTRQEEPEPEILKIAEFLKDAFDLGTVVRKKRNQNTPKIP